ncbi:hypothetical protein Cob_v002001 [Colletotrichum orbiculare MAFF 240422]|uniref:Uncharacterized protein n=1 Tax=Colletotrichum orbiculare (strain 104-T / ATCC 96160 / CBS 514.97 / LARS 414 / MAFF 240422) TaxID=1213857 RepID=A0A484G5K0_COLOR|nr:hypothetical protein Cob_v002001 [Colletotrichum orbiculare MAFF 240422]
MSMERSHATSSTSTVTRRWSGKHGHGLLVPKGEKTLPTDGLRAGMYTADKPSFGNRKMQPETSIQPTYTTYCTPHTYSAWGSRGPKTCWRTVPEEWHAGPGGSFPAWACSWRHTDTRTAYVEDEDSFNGYSAATDDAVYHATTIWKSLPNSKSTTMVTYSVEQCWNTGTRSLTFSTISDLIPPAASNRQSTSRGESTAPCLQPPAAIIVQPSADQGSIGIVSSRLVWCPHVSTRTTCCQQISPYPLTGWRDGWPPTFIYKHVDMESDHSSSPSTHKYGTDPWLNEQSPGIFSLRRHGRCARLHAAPRLQSYEESLLVGDYHNSRPGPPPRARDSCP